jgi:hypothetical protein
MTGSETNETIALITDFASCIGDYKSRVTCGKGYDIRLVESLALEYAEANGSDLDQIEQFVDWLSSEHPISFGQMDDAAIIAAAVRYIATAG